MNSYVIHSTAQRSMKSSSLLSSAGRARRCRCRPTITTTRGTDERRSAGTARSVVQVCQGGRFLNGIQ